MAGKLKGNSPSGRRVSLSGQPARRKLTAGSKAQSRANLLLAKQLRFIPAEEFERLEGDDQLVLDAVELMALLDRQAALERETAGIELFCRTDETPRVREWNSDAPLLTFEQEQLLFRALNLMLFRANRLRSRLSPSSPSKKVMDEIDRLLKLVEQIRGQLVNSNMRLVGSIARKFSSRNCDVDDLSSDGCMILLGAINRFDYSRGFRFSTYATHSIQRHFYRIWKQRQRRKERFPNAGSKMLSEISDRDSDDSVCDDPEAVVSNLLTQAESALDAREHQILLNRFGLVAKNRKAKTLREIAADMGLSKERVRQLQLKALEKLRGFLDPEQFFGENAGLSARLRNC